MQFAPGGVYQLIGLVGRSGADFAVCAPVDVDEIDGMRAAAANT